MEFSFADLEGVILKDKNLSEKEKKEFLRAFSYLVPAQQKLLFELFSEEPDLVSFMYDNFKRKKNNLHNPAAWEAIVKEELEFLNAAESP